MAEEEAKAEMTCVLIAAHDEAGAWGDGEREEGDDDDAGAATERAQGYHGARDLALSVAGDPN